MLLLQDTGIKSMEWNAFFVKLVQVQIKHLKNTTFLVNNELMRLNVFINQMFVSIFVLHI